MEYAPFQKFPKKGIRVDARAGTIDSDPDFITFIASLNGSSAVPTAGDGAQADGTTTDGAAAAGGRAVVQDDPLSAPLPTPEKEGKPKTTPLVEFIKQQKAAAASDKASTGGRSKSDKSKDNKDGKEGSMRRSEKRRLEKSRGKGREKDDNDKEDKATKQAARTVDMETATLLRREGSGVGTLRREGSGAGSILRNMSSSGSGSKLEKSPAADTEKPKRERRRERGNASSVAAILQRDLGLAGPRRSRVSKTALETAASVVESTNSTPAPATVQSDAPPAINATLSSNNPQSQQETAAKTPRSRGGSRRDRRNRLEREESANTTASGSSPQSNTTPVAILKKQVSLNTGSPPVSTSTMPTLLKRESSVSGSSAAASSGPAVTPASPGKIQSPTTPTAPKAGGGGGRRRKTWISASDFNRNSGRDSYCSCC